MHQVRNQRAETFEARHREVELFQGDGPQQGPDSLRPMANTAAPSSASTQRAHATVARVCRRRGRELFGKSRLSDTGLSANPDDTRPAALAVGQSANQYSKLAFSAEQLTRRGLGHSGFRVDAVRPMQHNAPILPSFSAHDRLPAMLGPQRRQPTECGESTPERGARARF